MTIEAEYDINGTAFRPVNADEIGFKADWTTDILEAELSTDSIVLGREGKRLVLDHIATNGIFEGVPLTVTIGTLVLEYYIDLTDDPKISFPSDSTIEVTIKRRKALDYFKNQANGLTWDLVNTKNPINTFNVPYLIIRDNQLELFISLTIAFYQLQKALQEGIRDLVEAVAEIIRAATPNIGIPPSFDTGDIISAVLLAVARLIYVAILLIAIIKIVKDIIELVFPPVKTLKASTVEELLIKGCAFLGYTFTSSVSEFSNMTILPKPILSPKEGVFKKLFTFDSGLRTLGYPTGIGGDSASTLGALVDFARDWCNGKLKISGNNVQLERRDFYNSGSGVQIHNTLNLQGSRENQYRYNSGEWWKRYYLKYRLDVMDVHTYDNISGIYSEHSTEPNLVTSPDLVLIKGLVSFDFPFALGSRKTELNFIEKAFLPFAKFGDNVVNFFGGSSNAVAKIEARVGNLQISSQYFSVTKLLYTVGGKQPANYLDLIGAEVSYQKYHVINQVKENFKQIYTATIPFSVGNFQNLLLNNFVNDDDGTPLEILTFEWINSSKTSEIEYAKSSDEGFNTKTILIEGGGVAGTTTTALN